jgi:hypothetical protein
MTSGSEFMMGKLTRKAIIEAKALETLRFHTTTICVSPQYEVIL